MNAKQLVFIIAVSLSIPAFIASESQAQGYTQRDGAIQVGGGLGFAASIADDEAFAFGFDFNYYFTHNLSLAVRLGVAVDGDFALIPIMVDGLWHFDIPSLKKLVPFAGLGLGVSILDIDDFDTAAAFTIEVPIGAEYYITRQFALGTEMFFMFPVHNYDFGDGPFGGGIELEDHFHFQWHIITARYTF